MIKIVWQINLLNYFQKNRSVKIRSKINNIGKKVLIKTYNEIFLTFKNEI